MSPSESLAAQEPAVTPDDEGHVQPVSASGGSRISSLDFIRGIAVLGILAANIVAFGQPFSAYMWPEAFMTDNGEYSASMWIAQFIIVDGKMRALFTLLFGAGMMLFMEKAWARGSTRWLQAKRLMFLLVFGLIHFFFIWKGDILTYYALTGLIALLFLKLRAKTQLIVGICGYLAGALVYAAMMVPLHYIADTPFGESAAMAETRTTLAEGQAIALDDDAAELPLISGGDYAGYVAHNFSEHAADPFANLLLFIWETLPLMLIGMAIYRMGMFDCRLDQSKQRMWGWIGLIVGAALTLLIGLWTQSAGFTYYATLAAFMGLSPIPRIMMALGLAALLSGWAPSANGWLGSRLSAAGRAAFTNYLGTSVLMVTVFHGWGLGLFGELTRAQLYLVVLGAWAVMLLWSKPWLERFRYGPLEWLWRCLTYGRLFPLKR
ncbi:DUF418 domain-containing protein [Pontixanthobacter gangjinensis]|uniref:DUF418 domain-containing protein n=1 Tax=Pontixanthobacter gangjinensis TaxID=1028742 RepID=A0A6I4SKR5_9SPHN|nr:DUF418 domain-containing protein [Pontixanthobacter gangjinensis]MXO56303.1 DUF418 domain-containing protein [Pontixanthobacter gangjinensis]